MMKLIGVKCVLDSRSNHAISDLPKYPFSFRGMLHKTRFLKTREIKSFKFPISVANLVAVTEFRDGLLESVK